MDRHLGSLAGYATHLYPPIMCINDFLYKIQAYSKSFYVVDIPGWNSVVFLEDMLKVFLFDSYAIVLYRN